MKKRSKVISILLATAMAGSMLAGCGGGNDSKSEGNDSKQTSESKEEGKEEEKEDSALAEGSDLSLIHI